MDKGNTEIELAQITQTGNGRTTPSGSARLCAVAITSGCRIECERRMSLQYNPEKAAMIKGVRP
jgi:hypothetical protein